jgi:hypothetical protein
LESLPQRGLETTIYRSIILALDAEVVLRGDASFGIVGIFVAGAVAEALGAGIVAVAEMGRHGNEPSFADVAAGFADGDGGGV